MSMKSGLQRDNHKTYRGGYCVKSFMWW